MFKKLLSNISFNPSLINQVAFYSKRLRKESSIRRLGVFFIIAAMSVQLFAVVAPAKPSLAASGNDMKFGGFSSQGDIVNYCKSNSEYAGVLQHFGIDCVDIFFGSVRNISSRDYGGQLFSMGRWDYAVAGETPVPISGLGTYYMRYLWGWDKAGTTSHYTAVVGTRHNGTPFMILFNCGNLVIVGPPAAPSPPPKAISCTNLIISVPPGSKVDPGSTILVKGQAYGTNIPRGELVDMHYDFIDVNSQVPIARQDAYGIGFDGSGTTSATDPQNQVFKVPGAGHYTFRLAIKYDLNGAKVDAAGNFVGSCARDIYVATTPPPPPPAVACSSLVPNFDINQPVIAGSSVSFQGQATERNLGANETVDMYYDYIDSAGKVIDSQKASAIPFKNSFARDPIPRSFKLDKAGTYKFRLAVKWGWAKDATGNRVGNCIKTVHVEPPCDSSKNNDVAECIVLHKKASNITQNIPDASGTVAHAGDEVEYILTAKNTSTNSTLKGFVMQENISDVLEYSDVLDLHGGKKDNKNIVTWASTDLGPGQTVQNKITVRIKNPIPQTPVSTSNPGSFDLTLTNTYGDTVNIKLPPSVTKTTEQVSRSLPNTGPGETIAIGFAVTVIAGYFFARSRLMAKELDLVRSEYVAAGGY